MNYTLTLPDNYVPPPLPGGKQWVEALRSGLYQQCTGQLCDGTGYCCLGVLSKVQGRLTPRQDLPLSQSKDGSVGSSNGAFLILAEDNPLFPALRGSGMFPSAGIKVTIEANDKPRELSGLNDAGLTFPQIADIIEAVWACE